MAVRNLSAAVAAALIALAGLAAQTLIGLRAGTLGRLGAFGKGAPVRFIPKESLP